MATIDTNHQPPTDLLSLTEAARLLPCSKPGRKVHVSSLVRWIQSGKLPGWKIAGRMFVSRSDVLNFARPIPVRPVIVAERRS